jgi:ketosteroid isomerase-like protein
MHPNEQLIQDFYTAFQARDGEKMASFYGAEATFSDPAFGTLHGDEIGGMWRMLCARGRDLRVEFRDVRAGDKTGSAHWEAWYTFSNTGRSVHNVIEAGFRFEDGKIIAHRDRFNFWRWASMALGPLGTFLGWAPPVQNKVRTEARRGLQAFMKKDSAKT